MAAGDDRTRDVEQAVLRRVTERAGTWFPDAGTAPAVRLRRLVQRPRAVLYAVHVGDGAPRVLAKVRRDWPGGAEDRPDARPRLATGLLPASELTALEFAGLRDIEAMTDPADPVSRALRALDHLVAENTILLEYVAAPTLRAVLAGRSRLSRPRRSGRRPEPPDAWRRAGAWLRRFQEGMPERPRPARQATREEVVDRFLAYDRWLTGRLGARAVGDVARRGAELAGALLPERLPLAVGHGDYAPRNVFVRDDGRLTVFDPLPRWSAPRLDDLSRFLVALRLPAVQVHTHGAAYGRVDVERREREVLEGYAGGGELPPGELRVMQLLITLDRWSALVDVPGDGWRTRLRTISAEMASRSVRGEAERLAHLAGTGG